MFYIPLPRDASATYGDHLVPKISNKMVSTEIIHTSGVFLTISENMLKNTFDLCSHRVKYTESEYDIQHNHLLNKTHQKHQNNFEL